MEKHGNWLVCETEGVMGGEDADERARTHISLKAWYSRGFYHSPGHAFPKPCKTIGKTTILTVQAAQLNTL